MCQPRFRGKDPRFVRDIAVTGEKAVTAGNLFVDVE